MKAAVFEILTWKANVDVSDQQMINAMIRFSAVVEKLAGFLHQSLYKNGSDQWVCIYFWQTEEEAHASNNAVAATFEFTELMGLIQEESITMEVLPCLQSNGAMMFS